MNNHGVVRSHIIAGLMIGFLVIWLRLVLELFSSGISSALISYSLVALPTCLLVIPIVRYSPPLAALFAIFGQLLYGRYHLPNVLFVPDLPFISVFTIWIILLLWHRRMADRAVDPFQSPFFIGALATIVFFLTIGIIPTATDGFLRNEGVRIYSIDFVRTWLGILLIVTLACRDWQDARIFLRAIPFAFLMYPISLPLEAWQTFFGYGIYSEEVLSVGLSFGTLNTNTMGNSAAFAAVLAIACAFSLPVGRNRWWYILIFIVDSAIGLMTGSRQFIISWLAGLAVIGLLLKSKLGFVWLLTVVLIASFSWVIMINLLPEESGFKMRLLEFAMPVDEWKTGSGTLRLMDFNEAIETWLTGPIFVGRGFIERPSHNIFLGMLVETGLFGLALFLSLWIFTVRRYLKSLGQLSPLNDAKVLRIGIVSSMTCVFIQQNISGGDNGGYLANMLLGFMLATIALSQKRIQKTDKRTCKNITCKDI